MKNSQKGFAPLALLIIIAVAAIGGGTYYFSNSLKAGLSNNTQATTTEQTAGWKVYKNSQYGFEFKYPGDFSLKDEEYIGISEALGKEIVPQYPSLTDVSVSVYKDYQTIKNASDKNIICKLKNENVPFGTGDATAREYVCRDAGSSERRLLVALKGGLGLAISITDDAREPETPKEYKQIPADIVSQILSSFKFTADDAQSAISSTSNWKTYSNAKYRFEFKYPKMFTGLQEFPEAEDCKLVNTNKGSYGYPPIVAIIDNITVSVICDELVAQSPHVPVRAMNVTQKAVTVAGKSSRYYAYETATGYMWKVIQIPIEDGRKYVEISYTFGNSHRLNKTGYELSDKEWSDILASFKIK